MKGLAIYIILSGGVMLYISLLCHESDQILYGEETNEELTTQYVFFQKC